VQKRLVPLVADVNALKKEIANAGERIDAVKVDKPRCSSRRSG